MTSPTYTWTGNVTFTGAIDPTTTNVATLTLTPGEGQSNLPAVINGTPGVPPKLRNVTVTSVPYGQTPPAASWTCIDPGGPGTAATYDLAMFVNSGQQGPAGTNGTLSGCSDVEGGPLGATTDGYALYYVAADSMWKISPQRRVTGPYICLPTNFNANYSGSSGSYTAATIGVPALPYAWRPMVDASILAGGTVNTRVDLAVLKGDPSTGDQVAYGVGQSGVGPFAVTAGPSFGAAIAGSSTYGQVPANTAATFYLVAKQINSTTDTWTTIGSNGRFSILAVPS